MNIQSPYENFFKTLIVVPDEVGALVISTPMPVGIYQSTGATPNSGKAYFETTNNGTTPNIEGLHAAELYALYSLIGLTWKQLAKIFAVDVRMLHYWIDGSRSMGQIHYNILNNLTVFASKSAIPVYNLKKLFEDYVLNNNANLRQIQDGDMLVFTELEKYIQRPTWNPMKVSDKFLQSRLPINSPVELMSSGAEIDDEPKTVKSRPVKVSRPKKS